jgi:hypothetical protein
VAIRGNCFRRSMVVRGNRVMDEDAQGGEKFRITS